MTKVCQASKKIGVELMKLKNLKVGQTVVAANEPNTLSEAKKKLNTIKKDIVAFIKSKYKITSTKTAPPPGGKIFVLGSPLSIDKYQFYKILVKKFKSSEYAADALRTSAMFDDGNLGSLYFDLLLVTPTKIWIQNNKKEYNEE